MTNFRSLIQALQLHYTHSCHQAQISLWCCKAAPAHASPQSCCINLIFTTCFSPCPGQSWNLATETSSVQKVSCCLHNFTRVQPSLFLFSAQAGGTPKEALSLNVFLRGGRCAVGESSSNICSTFEWDESGHHPTIFFFLRNCLHTDKSLC